MHEAEVAGKTAEVAAKVEELEAMRAYIAVLEAGRKASDTAAGSDVQADRDGGGGKGVREGGAGRW